MVPGLERMHRKQIHPEKYHIGANPFHWRFALLIFLSNLRHMAVMNSRP